MATRMQQRRGTAAQWTQNNPVLGPGEIGFESDNNKFKIGDGVNEWADLDYFTSSDPEGPSLEDYIPLTAIGDSVASLVSGKVPSSQLPDIAELSQDAVNQALTAGTGITKNYDDAANTLTVAVDTTTIATKSYVDTEIAAIPAVDISGKQDKVSGVSDTEIGYLDGVTSSIQTQLNAKLESSDLDGLATESFVTDAISEIPTPDYTGLATETYVDTAVANLVDTAPAALDTLNELAAALGDDANFATTVSTSLGNKQDKVSGVSDTEIGYLDGVTSAIQTQINAKAATSHTHAISDVTNLQTSLDAKAPLANPTFTGTVAGVTKAHVGLGNVDNTADTAKPVSTAQQTALDLKANIASPTFTGTVSGNASAASTAGNGANALGFKGIPASGAGASGGYTLVAADSGEMVYTTTTRTVTIPSNASVPFEIGTSIVFISGAGATTTIAITTDTMLLAGAGTTGSRTLAAHGMATAVKVAATTWYISGNGLT